ncbi:MAG: hypothetical protein KGZ71_09805 [Desulfobulbaceae bacterium]|nr:hypothetical protein [Desulfobulbaceae bacterium]
MAENNNKRNVIHYIPTDEEWNELTERVDVGNDSSHKVARRDLKRYYNLLKYALREANFTEDEAMLICDACNGVLFDDFTIRLMHASVADAIVYEGLDKKWGVDGGEVVAKLINLSIGALYAVADAVERWWLINHTDNTNNTEKLKSVGLIR